MRAALSVFLFLLWATAPTAQRRDPIDPDMVKAMAGDGLGAAIEIVTSFAHPRNSMSIYRDLKRGWGHIEAGFETPRPRRIALVATTPPLKWVADGVAVKWAPDGARAGQLVAEGHFTNVRCLFRGDVGLDRTTLSGTAVCGGKQGRFDAVVDRLVSCDGFDGVWTGRLGTMVLTVVERKVTGTFGKGGTVQGVIDPWGDAVGQWKDATGHGPFSLDLHNGASVFTASTSRAGEPNPTRWIAACTGRRPRPRK
jgi:hypothetical protein